MAAPTERSAVDLAAAIRRRELTSLVVVEAHVERLRQTHSRVNAVVADRYERALAEARACDQRIAQAALRGESTDNLPPLFGVPFTVKESIALQGMPQTAGILARTGQNPSGSATAVQRVLDAGAIPLGVTNVSELTLWIESDNPVYGRTNNPYDPSRTAGGSSGGEGAAVGVGGSPFGIGADAAGSIRIPALFCGVFGHKPSSGLVPSAGLWPAVSGVAEPMLAIGPLTRRAEDLMPLLRILAGEPAVAQPAGAQAADPRGADAQFADAPYGLRLGDPSQVSLDGLQVTIVEGASRRPISAALRDARERASGALASAGATVRTIALPSWRNAVLPFLTMLREDAASHGRPTHALLGDSGEPRLGLRELLFGAYGHTVPTRLTLIGESLPVSAPTRAKLVARGHALADELIDAIGDGVLLHPAHLTPAPHHHRTYGRPWLTTAASVFNIAGVPVTEVPIGLTAQGLPVGVQVAAAPGADHLAIAIAIELEAVFGGWRPPAGIA